jgi:peptide/nickel transport system substrate-binding protein
VDDLRPGEQEVGSTRTSWGQADSRLAHALPARARTTRWGRALAIVLGMTGALSAVVCTRPAAPPAPREPVTLTIGVPQSRQLDPSHGAPAVAETLAFERLTRNDADGHTRPRLLEDWSVAADGLSWRLRVRPDVRFPDGSLMTSADVTSAFETAIANPAIRDLSVCLSDVISVVARGDHDVVVSLKRRCSYLLDDLDRPVIRRAKDGRTRIGTGAFSVISSSKEEIVLEANRHYFGGRPAIDRVVVRPFDALRTAWAEMMRGRVDFLSEVGPDTAGFLSDQRSVEVRSFPGFYVYALTLNSARPMFKAPEVRRALSLAVDRALLVQEGLKGRGVPADSPVWPRHWAHDHTAPAPAFDPARASALLRAADPGGITFTCLVPANFAILERVGLILQQQLGSAGVRVRLESLQSDAVTRRVVSGDFDAAVLPILGGPSATVFHRFWHSPAGSPRWNFWGYRDARVDAALDAALEARDDRQFGESIRRFESAVRDNPPAIFLAWNETVQAISRRFMIPDGNEGRDAIYVLSRWLLRGPEGGAP